MLSECDSVNEITHRTATLLRGLLKALLLLLNTVKRKVENISQLSDWITVKTQAFYDTSDRKDSALVNLHFSRQHLALISSISRDCFLLH